MIFCPPIGGHTTLEEDRQQQARPSDWEMYYRGLGISV